MDLLTIILIIVVSALTYYFFKKKNLFERLDIPHEPPIPILGNMASCVFRKKTFLQVIQKLYDSHPEAKYIGMYNYQTPIIVIRDPEIIKSITIENFETFPDHSNFLEGKCDPLLPKDLFHLNGDDWRELRNTLSPSFNSSNMKLIFDLVMECATNFVDTLYERSKMKNYVVDLKDVFTKLSIDVIVSSVFGIEVDSMKDPKNEFYLFGREATLNESVPILKFNFVQNLKLIAKFMGIKIFDESLEEFVKDVIRLNIATRREKGIFRQDFLQMMIEVKYKNGENRNFSTEDIISNVFAFFSRGLNNIATQVCFITREIALNPEVQKKLQIEIDVILEKCKGRPTYDAINNMQYLDAVIKEGMRLYPSDGKLDRVCKKKFEFPPPFPGRNSVTVEPGMKIFIPVLALHRDPKYYKNSEKFDPGRFLGDRVKMNTETFLPFGIGPRTCIAYRFALLEMKITLFLLLSRCNLKPCCKTMGIKFNKDNITLQPEGGFWLNFESRK